MSHFCLLPNDDSTHSLLEPPSPAYTSVTVRRAFIVWLHCGQQNEFQHVCNYFHRLESLEDQLSAEYRATSRLHEFNLLSTHPPASHYLVEHFPKLYRRNKNNNINVKEMEEIKLEDCVFNLEGFHDMKIQKGVTTKDIIKTSQMIRKYCKSHSKSLKNFLADFQDFARKTEATNSVSNISMFIKKKNFKDELETWNNLHKNFSFLDNFEDVKMNVIMNECTNTEVTKMDKCPTFVDHTFNANKNANKIRILINESRRKEMMNLVPSYSEISLRQSHSNIFSNKTVTSSSISNVHENSNKYNLTTKN